MDIVESERTKYKIPKASRETVPSTVYRKLAN